MNREAADKDIVRSVLAGDVEAYAVLVRRHGPRVQRLLARHLPQRDVAETAQDAFVRAYASLGGFDPERDFFNWLATIALRCGVDRLRKAYARRETAFSDLGEAGRSWVARARAAGLADGPDLPPMAGAPAGPDPEAAGGPGTDGPEGALLRREAVELLHRALETLPPGERLALTLTGLEGRSTAEAAELLGVSRISIRVRTHRARRRLREILGDLMEEET